jgi:hypothetical protein
MLQEQLAQLPGYFLPLYFVTESSDERNALLRKGDKHQQGSKPSPRRPNRESPDRLAKDWRYWSKMFSTSGIWN